MYSVSEILFETMNFNFLARFYKNSKNASMNDIVVPLVTFFYPCDLKIGCHLSFHY